MANEIRQYASLYAAKRSPDLPVGVACGGDSLMAALYHHLCQRPGRFRFENWSARGALAGLYRSSGDFRNLLSSTAPVKIIWIGSNNIWLRESQSFITDRDLLVHQLRTLITDLRQ